MPRYRAFGTIIESDVPLSGLEGGRLPASGEALDAPPIRVDLRQSGSPPVEHEAAWHESPADDIGHVLRVSRNAAGDFRFRYTDGTSFLIAADGGSVTAAWPSELSLEDTMEYLLGPVIGFALRLRGVVCLHASAVAVGDACFAFLAPAGGGKSTTAAACARLGLPVLTDDVLALRERGGQFFVLPSYPRVRLWPEAVQDLFGSEDALPRLTPDNETWTKRYLDLLEPEYAFQEEALPLRCIYTPRAADGSGPSFESLSPAQALVNLIANVYSRSRPDSTQRLHEFDVLERVARTVPVKRFRLRRGIEHLSEQCRALARDCVSGSPPPAPASRA